MGEILDVAEALWKGEKDTSNYHPFGPPTGIEKIAHETWFYKGFANTVIRRTDDGLVIIDPSGFLDVQEKFDAVKSVVEPRLNTAIFTHGHVDHVLGVLHIKSNYHCPFRAHIEETKLVRNAPLMGDMFGLNVQAISGIDVPIQDEEKIPIGDYELQAILTPGHSRGSLSFYSDEGGFVITGDALFQQSIGRTDLPGGDYDTLIESIRTRLFTLPPETIVYPGHGPSSTIGEEIRFNPFFTMPE